jgi:hypothetical protein
MAFGLPPVAHAHGHEAPRHGHLALLAPAHAVGEADQARQAENETQQRPEDHQRHETGEKPGEAGEKARTVFGFAPLQQHMARRVGHLREAEGEGEEKKEKSQQSQHALFLTALPGLQRGRARRGSPAG